MKRWIVAMLAACGSATPSAPIQNQPAPTTAIVPADPTPDVTSCRAVVSQEYDDGDDSYIDASGNRVIVTTSDQCGLIMEPIYFARDSARVEPVSADRVAGMLACLAQTEDTKLRLELIGHATRDEHDPERLALARAQAVERYFTACGVPVLGLTATSRGTREPSAGDDPEQARAASRRVDYLILERTDK